MTAKKAIIQDTQLFKDSYACCVLDRPGHKVVGFELTHEDDLIFSQKLDHYDSIEGYNSSNPAQGYYNRSVRTAHLVDQNDKVTGETIETYIYHREGINEDEPIESGDWLKRKR